MSELLTTTFIGSLLGSLHCVGMCGGLAALSLDPSRRSSFAVLYNLGRLFAYLALGALAGALGAAVDLAGALSGIEEVASVLAGGIVIITGATLLWSAVRPDQTSSTGVVLLRSSKASSVFERIAQRIMPRLWSWPARVRALALGVASALLPCGWLYAFVLSAAGTGEAATGASLMGAFWLGTVPALAGIGLGTRHVARHLAPRLPWLMPIVLLAIGLLTVLHRGPMTLPSSTSSPAPCHDHIAS